MFKLGIVIPCHCEEAIIDVMANAVRVQMRELIGSGEIDPASFVCFVDDGSQDGTWEIIEAWHCRDAMFRGLKLSRNVGHQRALLAGLMEMRREAGALISLDADLQDPPTVIPSFVREFAAGNEIVYGVRDDRSSDSRFKRISADLFYRVMVGWQAELVPNHADCRLLGSRALEALSKFDESNVFLRGIVPLLGFPSSSITYARAPRVQGRSKYPLGKMVSLAWDGVTSVGTRPLTLMMWLGYMVCFGTLATASWVFYTWLSGRAVQGWTSMSLPLLFIGGVQLLCTGVIGQYLARIYQEVKRRPQYIVEQKL